MDKLCEVYVGTVVCDIRDECWVWFPTVVHSLLVTEDGHYKVIYSEKDKHIVRAKVTDVCDNYQSAFQDALLALKDLSTRDMDITEQNVAKRLTYIKRTIPDKRKIYEIDLNKEKKCDN